METLKGLPVLAFSSDEEWRQWLHVHHTDQPGVWFKFAKKASGILSVTYEEARNQAIAYGWIDGLKYPFDATYYLIRFTPRKAKSGWSKVNRLVVEKLIQDGLMQPAGLAQVEAAKKDGRWAAAYDSQATMMMPDDFRQALDANPAAAEFYATLKKSHQYSFLYRIQTAVKPETRAARIQKFVAMLEAGEAFHLMG
jgi:uncharacterized protein YdeI (YjbR/CyaY-like superfamily)